MSFATSLQYLSLSPRTNVFKGVFEARLLKRGGPKMPRGIPKKANSIEGVLLLNRGAEKAKKRTPSQSRRTPHKDPQSSIKKIKLKL